MKLGSLLLAATITWACNCSTADADDWEVGKLIVPTRAEVVLKIGREVVAHGDEVDWPRRVRRINGQWLWIEDVGLVGGRPLSGWVRKSEMVPVEDAAKYFSSVVKLNLTVPAWLLVYRGLAYQQTDEADLAQRDFVEAIDVLEREVPAWRGARRNRLLAKAYLERMRCAHMIADRPSPSNAASSAHAIGACTLAAPPVTEKPVGCAFAEQYPPGPGRGLEEQLANWRRAKALNPSTPWLWLRLANLYLHRHDDRLLGLRRYDHPSYVVCYLSKAIEMCPASDELRWSRGVAFEGLGLWGKAMQDHQDAIRLDPGLIPPYLHLAIIYAMRLESAQRDFARAVDLATKACELRKWRDKESLQVLACVYATQGDNKNAEKYRTLAEEAE